MHTLRRLASVAIASFILFVVPKISYAGEGQPAYHLAQGCYALQSASTAEFLAKRSSKAYQWLSIADSDDQVEGFYIKPSGLGRFMLHDTDGKLMSAHLFGIGRDEEASSKVEWEILHLNSLETPLRDGDLVTIKSLRYNKRLIKKGAKLFYSSDDQLDLEQSAFYMVPLDSVRCNPYPEAEINAIPQESFFEPQDPEANLQGYVDFHTHLGFTKTLAGVAMSGDTFHPYGIKHALRECSDLHGKSGNLDILEGQYSSDGDGGHDVSGYPEFNYWPHRDTYTHITAYYMWLKRAYYSGLRLAVTNVTGNPSYCQLLSVIHLTKAEGTCDSDTALKMQTQYIYDMQDYIDAQEGGPGKGWFRIAKSSAEARDIIAQNKLAIVLGSEYGTLFDCRHDEEGCSPDFIENKLDEIYDLGIRSVFPIHRHDNAFGGTRPQGGVGGAWMHLTSKFTTSILDSVIDLIRPRKALFKDIEGYYWDLEACPEGVAGTHQIKSMKDFVQEDFVILANAVAKVPVIGGLLQKFLDYSVIQKLEPLPDYKELKNVGACNRRALQAKGKSLLNGLMDRGMIIEIDHMSFETMQNTLSVLEARNYSGVVSSHSWFEDMKDVRERILGLGGIIAPRSDTASKTAELIQLYSEERGNLGFLASSGVGTDIQGIATQSASDPDYKPSYPFTSFDGKVQFTQPKTGLRSFDFNKEGVAHYGLMAEWVDNLRKVDEKRGTNTSQALFQSAEAYLRMWERAEKNQFRPSH